MVQLLLPFILGQFSRPWTADFMARNRKNLKWLDQGVICLVVYGAFGDLRRNGVDRRQIDAEALGAAPPGPGSASPMRTTPSITTRS